MGREAAETVAAKEKKKIIKVRGGSKKVKLFSGKVVNVIFKDKKPAKCEILTVEENPASKDFTRRSVITKGAILKVKTPDAKEVKVRVTSRPGQDGVINGVVL